ncbi:MAG: hypothetical protein NUV53_02900 [Patescibacteria group bacterium]|nr:hypothetical protein [Patescibacteria group bacterium]
MQRIIAHTDKALIHGIGIIGIPLARIALFTVYFWFGTLKLFGTSPASPLVGELLQKTLPFVSFEEFIIGFAIYEMIIGVFFLIPGLERIAIALLIPHLAMTMLPLVLLPSITWQGIFIPTLEGQYIIKNLAIIGLACGIASHLHPMKNRGINRLNPISQGTTRPLRKKRIS